MMSFRLTVMVLVALLAGCAQIAGLPNATAQVRVWEGQATIKGGNLLTPARGDAAGTGCIVSQVGEPTVQLLYEGERCRVCWPRCEATPAASEAPDSISP